MDELWSVGGAVALWIGVSCGLWWLHRRRTRARQNRQLEQAAHARSLLKEAQSVFDAIRTPVPLENPPQDTNQWLRAEAHALLKRIQAHGEFFDRVNTLRVQIQASQGIDDHTPLSELLQLRRDLWAASEILLVEDPARFGPTFAEDGAFEKIHAEAVQLVFKGAKRTGDDVIDLRLLLAANDADAFEEELQEAIDAAREKDRLPTISEIVAYPLGFLRAIPLALRTCLRFVYAFFGHAVNSARAIRRSEAMARGASRIRQAQDDWPQRLSVGFERASGAARDRATTLRKHYDFLVAAYDFRSKYEDVVRRAPEVTERGRQFIARLELAERSERLRLTSANAAIWLTRQLLDALARAIAAMHRVYVALRKTAFWRMMAVMLAPVPSAGRRPSAFRSYRRALMQVGLTEPLPAAISSVYGNNARPFKAEPHTPTAKTAKAARKAAPARENARREKPRPEKTTKRGVVAKPTKQTPQAAAKPSVQKSAAKSDRSDKTTLSDDRASSQSGPRRPFLAALSAGFSKRRQTDAAPDKANAETRGQRKSKAAKDIADSQAIAAKPPNALARNNAKAKPATVAAPAVDHDQSASQDAAPDNRISETTSRPRFSWLKRKKSDTSDAQQEKPDGIAQQELDDAASSQPTDKISASVGADKVETSGKKKRRSRKKDSPATTSEIANNLLADQISKQSLQADGGANSTQDMDETSTSPVISFAPETEKQRPTSEDQPAAPERRRSFFARLFSRPAKPVATSAQDTDQAIATLETLDADNGPAALQAEALDAILPDERAPTLMKKLSSLQDNEPDWFAEDAAGDSDDAQGSPEIEEPDNPDGSAGDADEVESDGEDENAAEPGPLTLSVLELQSKMKPKTPQIRSFPWLRG